jgi:hypothetical protein
VENVKLEDLRQLSQRFFNSENVHFSLIGPTKKGFQEKVKAECVC